MADIAFASSGTITLGGHPVPGGNLKLSDNVTAVSEIDYFLSPHFSTTLTLGIPPETHADGTGSLAGAGRLGAVTYGPTTALLNYHFSGLGRLRPWIGAGPTLMLVFAHKDGAIQHLNVDSHFGGAIEAGAEYRLGRRFGLYAAVAKLFLTTEGGGTFDGLPVKAHVDLNPLVVKSGLVFHFR